METITIAAAHFMSGGLNRLPLRGKKKFLRDRGIRRKRECLVIC
jgi:hypothetical protein